MLRRIRRWRAERWLRRHITEIDHDQAARMMRHLAVGAPRAALMFAERARDTAPTPALARHYERWCVPFRTGRRIKFGIYPVTILEPVPDALVEAVEQVFDEGVDE